MIEKQRSEAGQGLVKHIEMESIHTTASKEWLVTDLRRRLCCVCESSPSASGS